MLSVLNNIYTLKLRILSVRFGSRLVILEYSVLLDEVLTKLWYTHDLLKR